MVNASQCLEFVHRSQPVYFDTSFFIYYLEDNPLYSKIITPLFEALQKGTLMAHTSVLSILEMNVRPYQLGHPEIALTYTAFLKNLPTLSMHSLTLDMADRAAKLRVHYKLKTPDSIHIASALYCHCSTLLGNDKDFKKVKEINYLHLNDMIK